LIGAWTADITLHSQARVGYGQGRMRRLVTLISAVMMLDTVAYAAVIPLLPHYREELGLSPFGAGVLLAAYSAAVLLFAVPSGRLSDSLGPKRMTVAGAASLVVGLALMAVSHSFALLLVARLLQGGADAVAWSAGIAWVSSVSPAEKRGGRIGLIQAAGSIGFIAGPAIGAVAVSESVSRPRSWPCPVSPPCCCCWCWPHRMPANPSRTAARRSPRCWPRVFANP
jgi:MFS family permease